MTQTQLLEKRDAVKYLIEDYHLSARRSCECLGMSRAALYRALGAREERDAEVIVGINTVIERHPRCPPCQHA